MGIYALPSSFNRVLWRLLAVSSFTFHALYALSKLQVLLYFDCLCHSSVALLTLISFAFEVAMGIYFCVLRFVPQPGSSRLHIRGS